MDTGVVVTVCAGVGVALGLARSIWIRRYSISVSLYEDMAARLTASENPERLSKLNDALGKRVYPRALQAAIVALGELPEKHPAPLARTRAEEAFAGVHKDALTALRWMPLADIVLLGLGGGSVVWGLATDGSLPWAGVVAAAVGALLVADARRQLGLVTAANVRRAAPLIEGLLKLRGRAAAPYRSPAPGSTLPSPGQEQGAWQLVIRRDGQVVSEKSVDPSVTKIGRGERCHISLDDPKVSRMHAVIERENDELTIVDLGSNEGTLVDGKKVTKARLVQGDRVAIGPFELEVTRSSAELSLADTRRAEAAPTEPARQCTACGAGKFAAMVNAPSSVVPPGYRGEYCEHCGKVDLFKILD